MTSARPPIAVFAYRRATHLARTLDALQACPGFADSDVHVFSDGPRTPDVAPDVEAVRRMLVARASPRLRVIASPTNRGLANSIVAGVSELVDSYGRAIVIEDDLVPGPATLDWFAAALERFADDERVMQVSAHMYDVPEFASRREGLFLPLTTSWGWATWQRAWRHFDPSATGWESLRSDAALRQRFDLGGPASYAAALERQMAGRSDSWAIRWYWSVFRANGVGLFPPRSLIANIGFDGSGTHAGVLTRLGMYRGKVSTVDPSLPALPKDVAANPADTAAVARAIGRSFEPRWKRALRALLGR